MAHLVSNYVSNLFRLLRGDCLLSPLLVSYCVTTQCNLNCCYCEDFGARRNDQQAAPLALPEARQLLGIIRTAADSLILTGGEPLLYPPIEELVACARREVGFRHLTMISNGLLLSRHPAVLDHLDRLIISLDSADPEAWDQTLQAGPGTARQIHENIIAAASQQKARGFRLVAHCVITPETLPQARSVLEFCLEHDIVFSFSPQSVNNWPHYDLLTSNAYRAFIHLVAELKLAGAPILASMAYLDMMLKFEPYACYPLLMPRIMPDGALSYPCRPIERTGDAHGGRDINLLQAKSWPAALKQAAATYGPPPIMCSSCYQQCYVEPSLMQSQPLALLRELVSFAPSRYASIPTYAPG